MIERFKTYCETLELLLELSVGDERKRWFAPPVVRSRPVGPAAVEKVFCESWQRHKYLRKRRDTLATRIRKATEPSLRCKRFEIPLVR